MSTALAAVREELAFLRPRVVSLERAETVLSAAYENSAAPSAAKKRAARKGARSQSQRSPNRAQIREHIAAHDGCVRAEILAAVGGRAKSVDGHLARMVASGQITARGPRGRRRYSQSSSNGRVALPELTASASAPPERGVYPTYDAIVDSNGATTDQLATATKLPVARVTEEGRKLLRFGFVRFTGDDDERRWSVRASEARA
jgi:hypothetical protein